MSNIAILGSGGWGMALAVAFDKQGHKISLWSKFKSEVDALNQTRSNENLLKGIVLSDSILITNDITVSSDADIVIIAVPSFAVRSTVAKLKNIVKQDTVIVNVSKGFEPDSFKRLSVVISEELPQNPVVVLSGPSHAEEVAVGVPTSLVAACTDYAISQYVQDELISPTLRIYSHDDVIGVEVGGALKNVIAVCYGICDGLKLGDNTKAALMTRGLTEIARLAVKMGGREETLAGLAGIGELIVTCMSMHSRNHRFGILVGEGMSAENALDAVGKTVEGYHCAAIVHKLAAMYGVDMPITEQCYKILYKGMTVKKAIANLMERPSKHERADSFLN